MIDNTPFSLGSMDAVTPIKDEKYNCPICKGHSWGEAIRDGIAYGLCNGFVKINEKVRRCNYSWLRAIES